MEKIHAVVIPALDPDERLLRLVEETRALFDPLFVIVDDGSGEESCVLFDKLEKSGCIVLRHPVNLGKGAALKNAARYISKNYPNVVGYITADADYQHSPEDIWRVASALNENSDALILGVRDFSGKGVPRKSRWGNRITSAVFYLQTGVRGLDTQTGLRGVPQKYMRCCGQVKGERFEYEMNMLLKMAKEDAAFIRIPIRTLYIGQNRSSHFRPLKDSARIYWEIIKFSLSSLVCSGIDILLFVLFRALIFCGGEIGIMLSVAAARVFSGVCNFLINRNMIFTKGGNVVGAWVRYAVLFVCIMLAGGALTQVFVACGITEIIAKMAADVILFVFSFGIQKFFIFSAKRGAQP
jgi:glycosyltransferase involved in cell wall biosynthesis